ncbi:hypothetical protein VNO80_14656 [Phaseolus coccineus]|uniref:Uncharacterized protein n=1 Tax=Phaseolus coccineus TaxID=3886 RepID=A0AAN9R1K9_PHACN
MNIAVAVTRMTDFIWIFMSIQLFNPFFVGSKLFLIVILICKATKVLDGIKVVMIKLMDFHSIGSNWLAMVDYVVTYV